MRPTVSASDRYDTEIAFADRQLGRILELFDRDPLLKANTIFVFVADHGESLGEHGYWGHGRNLYEPALRIPLGFAWEGKIRPGTVIDAPALNLDVAPTLLGLVGLPAPPGFRGFDWTAVLGGAAPPRDRVTWFEAHKGAVLSTQEAASARTRGLLEVGVMVDGRKEVFRLAGSRRGLFDLLADPAEIRTLAGPLSQRLQGWMAEVRKGLAASDRLAPAEMDPENVARLRALGYAN
jgi:arylsulfatase A-like enzyme